MEPERAELARLIRDFREHVRWQRKSGVTGLPRELGASRARSSGLEVLAPLVAAEEVERGVHDEVSLANTTQAGASGADYERGIEVEVAAERQRRIETSERPTRGAGDARVDRLAVLAREVSECRACILHEQRTQTVFSRGNPFARIAFVGEGPGRDEDKQGEPFVGAAGQLLDKIIAAMGLDRDRDVYVCNVVKCRPPENRTPLPDEMSACGGFLSRQLEIVAPSVIVALGKTAASYLLGVSSPMAALRGKWHAWNRIDVRVTWHPAYLLRQSSAKRDTWEDVKAVLAHIGMSVPKASR